VVVLGGGAVSYERGTPVFFKCLPEFLTSLPRRMMHTAMIQGYLAHTKLLPHRTLLCLGPCGGPRVVEVSYERGTPVQVLLANKDTQRP